MLVSMIKFMLNGLLTSKFGIKHIDIEAVVIDNNLLQFIANSYCEVYFIP